MAHYTLDLDTTDAEETALAFAVKRENLSRVPPLADQAAYLLAKVRDELRFALAHESEAFVNDVAEAIAIDPTVKEAVRAAAKLPPDAKAEAVDTIAK